MDEIRYFVAYGLGGGSCNCDCLTKEEFELWVRADSEGFELLWDW